LIRRGIEWELREGGSYCSGSVTGGRNGWRREMTGGSHLSACRREGEDTTLGFNPGWAMGHGPWAVGLLQTWAGMVPGAIFYFYFLFFFLFSVFLISFILFAIRFKSSQTTFIDFAEFIARF
jgi:hypothetical protein